VRRQHRLAFLPLFFAFLVVCNCERSSLDDAITEQAAIENILIKFSAALASGDSTRLRALAGSSFILLDEGRFYNFSELIASIRPVLAAGTMTRTPKDFHTEVRGNVAWSRYHVGGEFRNDSGQFTLALLETAVLERVGKQWQVVQVSTIPEVAKPAVQP